MSLTRQKNEINESKKYSSWIKTKTPKLEMEGYSLLMFEHVSKEVIEKIYLHFSRVWSGEYAENLLLKYPERQLLNHPQILGREITLNIDTKDEQSKNLPPVVRDQNTSLKKGGLIKNTMLTLDFKNTEGLIAALEAFEDIEPSVSEIKKELITTYDPEYFKRQRERKEEREAFLSVLHPRLGKDALITKKITDIAIFVRIASFLYKTVDKSEDVFNVLYKAYQKHKASQKDNKNDKTCQNQIANILLDANRQKRESTTPTETNGSFFFHPSAKDGDKSKVLLKTSPSQNKVVNMLLGTDYPSRKSNKKEKTAGKENTSCRIC